MTLNVLREQCRDLSSKTEMNGDEDKSISPAAARRESRWRFKRLTFLLPSVEGWINLVKITIELFQRGLDVMRWDAKGRIWTDIGTTSA